MPLTIVRNTLTAMAADAIVNPSDTALSGSGGLDLAIHTAAGPALRAACDAAAPCQTGSAVLTDAFELPCRFIIHTATPRWRGGKEGETVLLRACYESALSLAAAHHFRTVAFPILAAGTNGFPKDLSLRTAIDTLGAFLLRQDMTLFLVVYDKSMYQLSSRLFGEIQSFIDDRYIDEHCLQSRRVPRGLCFEEMAAALPSQLDAQTPSLRYLLQHMDESFSEMLLRKIDETGMTDPEFYKKANIDRKLFSKLRAKNYRPSKTTAVALALALELPWEEFSEFLGKAGYSLSHASKFDIIVEYFVTHGNYNVFEIDEALFAFDQKLIAPQCRL